MADPAGRRASRAVYLTFDDGPNPEATPALLDVLARHNVVATFFVIDRHLTPDTAAIVRRAAAEGHAIALHSHTQAADGAVTRRAGPYARRGRREARRVSTGVEPCSGVPAAWRRAQRRHDGGPATERTAAGGMGNVPLGLGLVPEHATPIGSCRALAGRAGPGSIIVLHDGHHKNPRADRRYTIETVERLIPLLRAKGLEFGTICDAIGR